MTATVGKSHRNLALDFTKGALVLIMVLYHWLNYFVSPSGDMYKYLRFLTPSFICITGFLISSAYLSKYGAADPKLMKRLIQRGLKILGAFVVLNVAIRILFPTVLTWNSLFGRSSIANWLAIFITGNVAVDGSSKVAAFYILVPISYLLMLSAGLVIVRRFYQHTFYAAFAVCLAGILILSWNGIESGNLELLAIGLLGVILGHIPVEKIDEFIRHPFLLAAAYLAYVSAITIWDVVYPLQIVGVCLSLMLIYLLGAGRGQPGTISRQVILLGKYSLFGYIVQIAILQFLRRGFQYVHLGSVVLEVSFFAAFALTIVMVVVLDRARAKSATVDGLYKAVLA